MASPEIEFESLIVTVLVLSYSASHLVYIKYKKIAVNTHIQVIIYCVSVKELSQREREKEREEIFSL